MTNDQAPMTNERRPQREVKFDLADRTATFGEQVIAFAKTIPVNPVTAPLISQIVRCGTSIGANYCEADEADTRKDFRYRIGICKRESKETKYQIRMLVAAEPRLKEAARPIWQEAKELTLILAAILRSGKER
jgi:four helix bundle protein